MRSPSLRPPGPVPKTGKKKRKTKAEKELSVMREAKADMKEPTLWRRFAQYIKYRDCKIALTNPKTGNYEAAGQCISCGALKFVRELECGHYIRRRWKATKYDERNNNAQCNHCNQVLNGNEAEYRKALIEKYSFEDVEELEEIHREITKKMDTATIVGLTAYYRQKTIEEAERLGVEPPK